MLVRKPEGKDHAEDLIVCGRIMLGWSLRKRWKVVDWILLAEDRDQWPAFVNTVMNLWVP
jgi:hypothetical protein